MVDTVETKFTLDGTTYFDLTDPDRNDDTDGVIGGDQAAINGALFTNFTPNATSGTGVISAFVRVQATGDEEGYNFDNPDEDKAYDENTSPQFTRNLLLSEVPIIKVMIDGVEVDAYEFRLDINQTNGNPYLSLDQLKVFTSTSDSNYGEIDDLTFTDTTTKVYDLDDDQDPLTPDDPNNSVLLNYDLQAGSGRSDMFFYVPVTKFGSPTPAQAAQTYVVLYSKFGETAGALENDPNNVIRDDLQQNYASNDGFEEWSISKNVVGTPIYGYKWEDMNGNGAWDDGEQAIGGWAFDWTLTYTTEVPGQGTTNDIVVTLTGTSTTDSTGRYTIIAPGADSYKLTISEVFKDGVPGDPNYTWVNTYDGTATLDGELELYEFDQGDLPLPKPNGTLSPDNVSGTSGDAVLMNFGNFKKMVVSGYKWEDNNGINGWDESNAAVLSGWTIYLDNNTSLADGFIASAVTDADGHYSFRIGPVTDADGILHVYEEQRPGVWEQTFGGFSFAIESGLVIDGALGETQEGNFGNFELFDINGHKYDDINGDESVVGDPGLGNVTIFIDMDGSKTVTTGDKVTTTSSALATLGYWEFTDLDWTVAGKTVFEVLPGGYVQTLGKLGYTITGTSGTSQIGLNFANFELFDIRGIKVIDDNGNGIVDIGDDEAHAGVTIYIDVNKNGTFEADEDKHTTTNALGEWAFTDLGVGFANLKIYEYLPTGSDYIQTVGMAGFTIDGTSGADQSGLTFANYERYDISGRKFTDETGDGQSGDDTGLGGVTVFIDANDDDKIAGDTNEDGVLDLGETWTEKYAFTSDGSLDSNGDGDFDQDDIGLWSIKDLDWTYAGAEVKEITPGGYVQTVGQVGTITDTEYLILGTSGDDQTGLNFANFQKFMISGFKYTDIKGDGLTDDDTGLGGVTIFIDSDGDGKIAGDTNEDGVLDLGETWTEKTAVTADDGSWEIADLDYTVAGDEVKEITPDGYVQTVGQIGTITDTSDTHLIVATSGNDQDGFDFANFKYMNVSGYKWEDHNGNSGWDESDAAVLENWTIVLDRDTTYGNGNEVATTTTGANGKYSFQIGPVSGDGDGILHVYELVANPWVKTYGGYSFAIASGLVIDGTLGAAEEGNFGNYELFDLNGHKYTDVNGDGDVDPEDTGLGGVRIFIDMNDNDTFDAGDISRITADGLSDANHDGLVTPADKGYWEFLDLDWTVAGKTVFEELPGGYVQTLGMVGYTIAGTSGESQLGLNFANFELFDVRGIKVIDTDGDGVVEQGENEAHAGVTIYIDLNNNGAFDALTDKSTTTAADGSWAFTNLGVGFAGKKIYEYLPAGSDYLQTVGIGGFTIIGTSGADQSGLTFANFEKFDVTGYKWNDSDGDGVWETGEPGKANWTIYLDIDSNKDGTVDTTLTDQTDANGFYEFRNLGPGNYTVREDMADADWTNTYNGTTSFAGASGVDRGGDSGDTELFNFGNFQEFDVTGYKWNDSDGDGVWETGEPGKANWTIYLDIDSNKDGTVDTTLTDQTDANGFYEFRNLGPGTYSVRESTADADWTNTYDGSITFDGASGVDRGGDKGDTEDFNFGNFQLFDISGHKFVDTNGDGDWDGGEPVKGGWTIYLRRDTDGDLLNGYEELVDETTTDLVTGKYSFGDLGPGNYQVTEDTSNADWINTVVGTWSFGGASGVDRDAAQGATVPGNFGNFERFDVSGKKVIDTDGDGVIDAGETTGHVGVTIYIDMNNNGAYDVLIDQATVTGTGGTWAFNNLGTGYIGKKIYEYLPAGSDYVQTFGNSGYTITGTSGTNQTGLNFANFEKFDISGFKWADLNNNSDWDELDTAVLGGWTIVLDVDQVVNGNEIATRITDADGFYSFDDLAPGAYEDGTLVAGTTYYVYEVLQDGFTKTFGGFSFTLQSGVDTTGTLGVAEPGNFGNYMMAGANRTPGFWQSTLGQSFYDGNPDNNGDANGPAQGSANPKDYNLEGWSEIDLLLKYGVDTDGNGTKDSFLVFEDGDGAWKNPVTNVLDTGDIFLTPTQLAEWVGGTGTSLEMLERAVGAAFLNTLNNHSISEADYDASGEALDLWAYMDGDSSSGIELAYRSAVTTFIKRFDDGAGPGQFDNSGTAWDGITNASKKQQQDAWNGGGSALHTILAAYNEDGNGMIGGKMAQFKMDGDDYSSKLVQDYLAVQQQTTLAGSTDSFDALAGSNYKFSDIDTLHMV